MLDVAFITHKHGDHFNRKTARVLAEKGRCVFVMPANCVEEARRLGIPEGRITVATPRKPFELKGVKVSPLRAIHGNPKSAVYFDANLEDCGYLIELGGKTFLQPGDSVLLEDHLFLKHVDVLFFSPTEHNMHVDPSVILINELEPEYILPQHRDTYRVTPENRYWTSGYPHEVKLRLSKPLQAAVPHPQAGGEAGDQTGGMSPRDGGSAQSPQRSTGQLETNRLVVRVHGPRVTAVQMRTSVTALKLASPR